MRARIPSSSPHNVSDIASRMLVSEPPVSVLVGLLLALALHIMPYMAVPAFNGFRVLRRHTKVVLVVPAIVRMNV